MPATTLAFATGALGMIGLFPLGCFWGMRMGIDFLSQGTPLLAGVFLVVNLLTAVNLTRVFRLVFLGPTQPKTRRAPEAPWQMAVPMVFLSIFTLLVPAIMGELDLLPTWQYINPPVTVALIASGAIGVALGYGDSPV
jgi:NAD(P)H-quinone oxidoreductase subunit 5